MRRFQPGWNCSHTQGTQGSKAELCAGAGLRAALNQSQINFRAYKLRKIPFFLRWERLPMPARLFSSVFPGGRAFETQQSQAGLDMWHQTGVLATAEKGERERIQSRAEPKHWSRLKTIQG